MSKPATLPVYRANLSKPYPQKSMVQVTDRDSMYHVHQYPSEHFFDLDDAWVALEQMFRKQLQEKAKRLYDTKAEVSRIESQLAELEQNLATISRRDGVA